MRCSPGEIDQLRSGTVLHQASSISTTSTSFHFWSSNSLHPFKVKVFTMRLQAILLLLLMEAKTGFGSPSLAQQSHLLDTFLGDLENLLDRGRSAKMDCTIVSIGKREVVSKQSSDQYPFLLVNPASIMSLSMGKPDHKPLMWHPCYYVLFEEEVIDMERLVSMVNNVSRAFNHVPKLVVLLTNNGESATPSTLDISCPWITVIKLQHSWKVTIACVNCVKIKTALWNHSSVLVKRGVGAFSSNLDQPICCNPLEGKTLRISYRNWGHIFQSNSSVIDTSTYEGEILQSFIEKHKLIPELLDAGYIAGNIDKKTGLWRGIIGNVGYNRSDVGVGKLAVTYPRYSIVDPTFSIMAVKYHWMCKFPDPVNPYMNLLYAYDLTSWLLFVASIIAVGLTFLFVLRTGRWLGMPQPDVSLVMLYPLGMASAESGEPAWLRKSIPGRTIYLFWAFMGMILVFGFLCNYRTLLLKIRYEKPIDSTEELVKSGKEIWVHAGTDSKRYLSESDDEWHKKAAQRATFRSNKNIYDDAVSIAKKGKACYLITNLAKSIPVVLKKNPKYKILSNRYFSREIVRSLYIVWPVQKKSIWQKPLNQHIHQYTEAGLFDKIISEVFPVPPDTEVAPEDDNTTQVEMKHFIGPMFCWMVGFIPGFLVLLYEIYCKTRKPIKLDKTREEIINTRWSTITSPGCHLENGLVKLLALGLTPSPAQMSTPEDGISLVYALWDQLQYDDRLKNFSKDISEFQMKIIMTLEDNINNGRITSTNKDKAYNKSGQIYEHILLRHAASVLNRDIVVIPVYSKLFKARDYLVYKANGQKGAFNHYQPFYIIYFEDWRFSKRSHYQSIRPSETTINIVSLYIKMREPKITPADPLMRTRNIILEAGLVKLLDLGLTLSTTQISTPEDGNSLLHTLWDQLQYQAPGLKEFASDIDQLQEKIISSGQVNTDWTLERSSIGKFGERMSGQHYDKVTNDVEYPESIVLQLAASTIKRDLIIIPTFLASSTTEREGDFVIYTASGKEGVYNKNGALYLMYLEGWTAGSAKKGGYFQSIRPSEVWQNEVEMYLDECNPPEEEMVEVDIESPPSSPRSPAMVNTPGHSILRVRSINKESDAVQEGLYSCEDADTDMNVNGNRIPRIPRRVHCTEPHQTCSKHLVVFGKHYNEFDWTCYVHIVMKDGGKCPGCKKVVREGVRWKKAGLMQKHILEGCPEYLCILH